MNKYNNKRQDIPSGANEAGNMLEKMSMLADIVEPEDKEIRY